MSARWRQTFITRGKRIKSQCARTESEIFLLSNTNQRSVSHHPPGLFLPSEGLMDPLMWVSARLPGSWPQVLRSVLPLILVPHLFFMAAQYHFRTESDMFAHRPKPAVPPERHRSAVCCTENQPGWKRSDPETSMLTKRLYVFVLRSSVQ